MVRSRTSPERGALGDVLQPAFVVELGVVATLLVGFQAYLVGLNNVLDPYFLDSDITLSLVRGLLSLAGMGALVTAYAVYRGDSLPVSLPDRPDGRLLGGVVVATVTLAVAAFVPLGGQAGVGITDIVSAVLGLPDLLLDRTLVRLTVFVLGMVLLYHGLVQTGLQRILDRDRNLTVAVTTLVGGYLVTPQFPSYGTFGDAPWLYIWGTRAVVAAVFVLALGVTVYAKGRTGDGRIRALAMLPVVAAVALTALVLATAVESPMGAVAVAPRIAVVGIAAYAYDRTESMVAPTLAYATFALVSAVLHSAAIGAALAA